MLEESRLLADSKLKLKAWLNPAMASIQRTNLRVLKIVTVAALDSNQLFLIPTAATALAETV